MGAIASQITSLTVVYSTVYSDADQGKHQISASLAFVWGIHRDRGIPRPKGQLRGKCFHLMTSSWETSPYLCLVIIRILWRSLGSSFTSILKINSQITHYRSIIPTTHWWYQWVNILCREQRWCLFKHFHCVSWTEIYFAFWYNMI